MYLYFPEGEVIAAGEAPTQLSVLILRTLIVLAAIFIEALQSFLLVSIFMFRPLLLCHGEEVEIRASYDWCCTASGQ